VSLRTKFIKHCGPVGVTGATLPDWLRILLRNGFAIPVRYWPRAFFTTLNSCMNSVWKVWEDVLYRRRIEQTTVPPPLFILGAARSGTTHLHNLLSKDDRFAFPNTYQVLYPHTFLTTEYLNARTMQLFMDATRPMDNVRSGVAEPQEDEYAMVAGGLSFMLELSFPRTGAYYHRFLSLRDVTPAELSAWKAHFIRFLRKLTYKHQRPLILKSPGHTCRIRLLLELFPQAKFVHIHRNPFDVYRSTVHTAHEAGAYWAFQDSRVDTSQIVKDYIEVYDAFFEQRSLIPDGSFCEVAFEQLERDPIAELKRIYETLRLPSFGFAEPKIQEYVESIASYQKNAFPELPLETRELLSQLWARSFDEWGYGSHR